MKENSCSQGTSGRLFLSLHCSLRSPTTNEDFERNGRPEVVDGEWEGEREDDIACGRCHLSSLYSPSHSSPVGEPSTSPGAHVSFGKRRKKDQPKGHVSWLQDLSFSLRKREIGTGGQKTTGQTSNEFSFARLVVFCLLLSSLVYTN